MCNRKQSSLEILNQTDILQVNIKELIIDNKERDIFNIFNDENITVAIELMKQLLI